MNIDIEAVVRQAASLAIQNLHPPKSFVPGVSDVPVTGKVFGSPEIESAVRASLDFWLTSGPYSE